jgi:hypothetical protein
MSTDYFGELHRAIRKHAEEEPRHTPEVVYCQDAVVLRARPEPLWLYLLFFAVVVGAPAGVILEELSYSSLAIGLLWLALFIPLYYSLTVGDIAARLEPPTRTVHLQNISPIVRLFRRMGLKVTYPYEGSYPWTDIHGIQVRQKHYGKARFNMGHRLHLVRREGKPLPFAEFRTKPLAEEVAAIVARMISTG